MMRVDLHQVAIPKLEAVIKVLGSMQKSLDEMGQAPDAVGYFNEEVPSEPGDDDARENNRDGASNMEDSREHEKQYPFTPQPISKHLRKIEHLLSELTSCEAKNKKELLSSSSNSTTEVDHEWSTAEYAELFDWAKGYQMETGSSKQNEP